MEEDRVEHGAEDAVLALVERTVADSHRPRAGIAGEVVARRLRQIAAPVERRDWFIAKILVLLTLAIAYYMALVPMALVYAAHIGVPLLLKKFLIWSPGLLLVAIAVGLLVGVLFIGRSMAAPAATGMGLLLVYAALVPLQELMVARNSGATRMGRVTLLSPAVLLKNALDPKGLMNPGKVL